MPILDIVTDSNGIGFDGDRSNRTIYIPTEAALQLFEAYSVKRPELGENLVNLYSFTRPRPGEPNKVRFANLSTPRHLLQKANGCGWNPKGTVSPNLSEYTLGSVDYDGEQCPDEFGECFDGIFGDGNQAKDMLSTPAGRGLFEKIINRIYVGLGNSLWDLLMFANHPITTLADTNSWYGVSATEWADYFDQQIHDQVGGIMTIIDNLKDVSGLEQLQGVINSTDLSADGTQFTGDVVALFENVIDIALPDFRIMIDEVRGMGAPIMLVSKSVFKAYKDYLTGTYNQIPDGFQLFYKGDDGLQYPVRNVLQYDGIWIVQASSWAAFDRINGVNTHRAVLTAPGNFGVGYDTEAVRTAQFNGIGMTVNQWLQPPYKGQIYMSTRFALTGAVVDPDFLSMASYIAQPS